MPMAQLGDDTRDGLGKILPSFATTTNPVDITAALLTNSGLFGQILPVHREGSGRRCIPDRHPGRGSRLRRGGFAATRRCLRAVPASRW